MRIVMTGGTSGIGLNAARAFIAQKDIQLTIGARRPNAAARDLCTYAMLEPLDLADLGNVRRFASRVVTRPPVDVLIGNAGVQCVRPAVSAQGIELTFAANHLAHYLLIRLLLPALAPNARIILTSSGTHDPAMKTGMPAPRHADANLLAYPDRDPDHDVNAGTAGRRAYSTSKLCNLMTIRELARRMPDRPDLTMLAFDPGFCPGTGLASDYGPVVSAIFRHVLPLIVRGAGTSDPVTSGRALAALATDTVYAGGRGTYWSMHHRQPIDREPSTLARDDAACAKLWDDSAALVGLAP
jgi:protochlorophyllide reductase